MPYIPPEVVARAREMDLLTYLRTYEPQELVHFGGSTYCTREHDSLKISNGKWCWFSRGIGGYSALDYLIKVKEMPFTQAVETIMGNLSAAPPAFSPAPKTPKEKVLLLPQANRSATHAIEYLHRRGIDYELIDFCIKTGRLYESYPYHNVVFVGMDADGKPRYANQRGIDVFSHGITFRFVGILLADAVHTLNVKYDIACLCGRHGVGERFAFADGKLECICNGSAEFVRNLNLADTLIAVVGERQREGLSFFCRHTLFNCGAQAGVDHAENLVGNRCFAFRAIRQEPCG